MIKAPIPSNEKERLNTLNEYDVLDTVQEQFLDEITKTAALICDCKISLISLIDSHRQWFKSKQGLDAAETLRDISFCGHAIMEDDLFIVEDSAKDIRFCDNPLFLKNPKVCFYAGAPLIAPNGHKIGTLCVIDSKPKILDEKQKLLLKSLSTQVMSFLELRKKSLEHDSKTIEIEDYKAGLDAHAIITRTDTDGKITFINKKFCEISKYNEEELIGKDHRIINSDYHPKEFFSKMWEIISRGEIWRGEVRNKAKDGSLFWVDSTLMPLRKNNGEISGYMAFRYDITAKKEAELLYGQTQALGKIGGWDLNVQTLETKWTDETYKIHELEIGTPTNTIAGINFYAEHERPKIQKMVYDCIEKGIAFESDFEFITAKGNKKWVHSKGIPEFNSLGKVIRITGTFQDISTQKILEKKLIDSHQYLDLALEGAGLGVWDWNLTDNSVKYDHRWASMLGFDISELQMNISTWESKVHPDDLENCYKDIKLYMDGKTDHFENIHRTKHKNGSWVYILGRGRFSDWDKNGKPIRFTGTNLDITETKSSQDQKLSEFNEILSATPSCLKIISKEGTLLEMNEQGLALIEADCIKDVYKMSFYTIVAEEYREKFKDFNEKTCNGNKESLIFEIINLKGKRKWMETYSAPFKLPTGEIANISITNDITNKRMNEKEYEIQKAISQHQAKLASIGELAAGVGHEINNPLTIIKGYLTAMDKTLKNNLFSASELQNFIQKIHLASDRIANIVQGLRTFSRSDSHEVSSFSPITAVKESFNMINQIYLRDGVKIELVNSLKEDIVIIGNRGKFQQVLMNLLSNAKDAVSNAKNKKIEVLISQIDKDLLIAIKDYGCGIPTSLHSKIFEPFFTTKEVNKGTGIGLSLAHNFIKEMNGTLSIESEENLGSTFTVRIPLAATSILSLAKKVPSAIKPHYKASAIIAEDEEDIREILCNILESMGIKVTTAVNGLEAYKLYTNAPESYDLIVSDMKMPEMDGASLLKSVRSHKNLFQPKFLFITGGININFEDKTIEINKLMDGYLFKPFDHDEILELLSKCLKNKLDVA
jgi:PAS domain S-box-containing protein